MKKLVRSLFVAMLVFILILSLISCGQAAPAQNANEKSSTPVKQEEAKAPQADNTAKQESKPVQNIKLNVWIGGTDGFITAEEQKKAQEEWYISKAFRRFEKANPGVAIEMTVPPDQMEAHQTFKAAGMAKNGPDLANLWTGQYIFQLKDVIYPLDGKIPQDDLSNISGWETVRDGFSGKGAILGYPATGSQVCFFLYNKKLVKAAGVDFEANPPRSTQEFDEAMKRIKATGVTPIVTDEGSFPWFMVYIANYWWAQETGHEGIVKDCNAESKFSEDKGFINELTYYSSLYKNGYVNKDAGTSSDSWNRFLQGKAALYPTSNVTVTDAAKVLGEDNIGVLSPPEINSDAQKFKNSVIGGPGQCVVVSNSSKNPDMAIKLASFLNSKEETLEFEKLQPRVPLRKDITLKDLGWEGNPVYTKMFEFGKNTTYWVDNTVTADIMTDIQKLAPLVFTGKMPPVEMAKQLDKRAQELKQK